MPPMPTCTSCGGERRGELGRCPACGARQGDPPAAPPTARATAASASPQAPQPGARPRGEPPRSGGPVTPTQILHIVAVVMLVVVVGYAGAPLVLPAVFGALLAGKLVVNSPEELRPFVPALAVQGGHVLSLFVALLLLWRLDPILIDLALWVPALLWLCRRPGRAPVMALLVLQGASLVINVVSFGDYAPRTPEHRGLTANVALRVYAIATLLIGWGDSGQRGRESVVRG